MYGESRNCSDSSRAGGGACEFTRVFDWGGGELEQAIAKCCREWASQFSIENMVKRYEELCKEAIEGGW